MCEVEAYEIPLVVSEIFLVVRSALKRLERGWNQRRVAIVENRNCEEKGRSD